MAAREISIGRRPVGRAVARRLLRYVMTLMCERNGVTHAEMGARLGMSRASFTRLTTGKNLPSRPALEVTATHLNELHRLPRMLELLGEARHGDPGDIADPVTVALLTQSPAHTRALYTARARLDPAIDTDAVLTELELRQTAVTGHRPAQIRYLADETALRRTVGGGTTMAEQYDHLLTLADLDHVTLRVVPADVGVPLATEALQIMNYDDTIVVHHHTGRHAYYHDQGRSKEVLRRVARTLVTPVHRRIRPPPRRAK